MNGTDKTQTINLTPYKEVLPTTSAHDVLTDQNIDLNKNLTLPGRGMLVFRILKQPVKAYNLIPVHIMNLKKNLSLIAFLCISFIANAQQKTELSGW